MLENTYCHDVSGYLAEFVLTDDHSLSLRLSHDAKVQDDLYPELMHSTAGAFSETIYVYLPVVKGLIERGLPLRFLSVGLGLGYIEVMIVAYCLSQKREIVSLESFEAAGFLIQYFENFFLEKPIPQEFFLCFNDILKRNSVYFGINQENLKNKIKNLILHKKINIRSKFTKNSVLINPAHGIFFDAFSQTSCPDLWSQSLLSNVFSQNCSFFDCVFATYASNGCLKKCLKEHGFIIHKKHGFFKKRECVFAERHLNKLSAS